MPGPAAYRSDAKNSVIRRAPSFGFGTSVRPHSAQSQVKVPGPGSYTLRGLTGNESQGKTLGLKHANIKSTVAFNPGPGTYDAPCQSANPMLRKSPNWKIGSATRDEQDRIKKRVMNNPPPDTYSPNFMSAKEAGARWKFGTSMRTPLNNAKNVPGPNAYQPPSKAIEGPTFHMGLKLDSRSSIGAHVQRTKFVPGAGVYDPDYKKTKN